MALSYEEGKKVVFKGLILLAIITLIEVFIALIGNGHIIEGFKLPKLVMYPVMIALSLYKAYFIVYEFMHMRYEVKSLAMTVLLPMCLLIWALIAFMNEGGFWESSRTRIELLNSDGFNEVLLPKDYTAEGAGHDAGSHDSSVEEGHGEKTQTGH